MSGEAFSKQALDAMDLLVRCKQCEHAWSDHRNYEGRDFGGGYFCAVRIESGTVLICGCRLKPPSAD